MGTLTINDVDSNLNINTIETVNKNIQLPEVGTYTQDDMVEDDNMYNII